MTRGGPRKGAGRPKTKGEKLTVPLPVRVTPTELANIKRTAASIDTPLGRAVRDALEQWCEDVARVSALAVSLAGRGRKPR